MGKKKNRLTKEEIKRRQVKTLRTMKIVRQTDAVFLRKIIEEKLEFAKSQKIKAEQSIEVAQQNIEQNTVTRFKLVGMIMVLNELLEEKDNINNKETK